MKILCATADLAWGNTIITALKNKGYEVEYTASSKGILSLMLAYQPDTIVLSTKLSSIDPLVILHKIQIEFPDIPIICISPRPSPDEVIKVLQNGALCC